MKKSKKITLGTLSALVAVAAPVAAVVSCGKDEKSKDMLKELESKFNNSIKENVSLRVPYLSQEQDKEKALLDYKNKIQNFFTHEGKMGGDIYDEIVKRNTPEKSKLSDLVAAETLSKSFKSEPTKKQVKEFEEKQNAAQAQKLTIKEFVFFDASGKNKNEVTVKVEKSLYAKLEAGFLAGAKMFNYQIKHSDYFQAKAEKKAGFKEDKSIDKEFKKIQSEVTKVEKDLWDAFDAWKQNK